MDHGDFAEAAISDADIAAYERDGAVIIRNAISSEWVAFMRAAIDEVLAHPTARGSENAAPGDGGRFYGDTFVWLGNRDFAEFLFTSPLAEVAARIMRAQRVNFLYDQLLVKEPGSNGSRTPWHQDLPYGPVKGWQIASVWVPFDRATPENGVVTYVKGSHLWGKMYQSKGFGSKQSIIPDGVAPLEEAPDIDSEPWKFEFVTGVLEPGDVFIHHASTLHGAPGNSSANARRRALATRWTGEDVVWDERPQTFLKSEKYAPLRKRISLNDGDPLGGPVFRLILPRTGSRMLEHVIEAGQAVG